MTGDGTVGDPVPGSQVGSFGRDIKAGNLNQFISNYNSKLAGQLTPAGQALVSAGLFTQAQLQALGAVTPTLALAPKGEVGISPLFTFDAHVAWELHLSKLMHAIPERVVVDSEPGLGEEAAVMWGAGIGCGCGRGIGGVGSRGPRCISCGWCR